MSIKIMVEGDYALFTRPEMKTERVSYDVPTVSALEGLIKCIYWKPAFRICISKIIVFNPIRFTNSRDFAKSSSVSPGNPTITSVVNEHSGKNFLIRSVSS